MTEYSCAVEYVCTWCNADTTVIVNLSATGDNPAFVGRNFCAMNPAKREVLAMAIACITAGKLAFVQLESTNEGSPITAFTIHRSNL